MTYFIGGTGPDVTMTVQPDCLKHFYVTRKYSDEGGADYGEYQNNVMFSPSLTIKRQESEGELIAIRNEVENLYKVAVTVTLWLPVPQSISYEWRILVVP